MREISYKLKNYFYKNSFHPYRIFQEEVEINLKDKSNILDIGCGRHTEVLSSLSKNEKMNFYGIDCVDFIGNNNKQIFLIQNDASNISFKNDSFDVIISRSVIEHLENPFIVFREINRVLKSKGKFIFLTPNLYDYASIISKIIPNKFHNTIVRLTEGRDEDDTFPAYYRANTYRSIKNVSEQTGFNILNFDYLGQYPSYFMFNPALFLIGTVYDKFVCSFKPFKFLRSWCIAVLQKDD